MEYDGLMFIHNAVTISYCVTPESVEYTHIQRKSNGSVNSLWLLYGNQSTVNVFYNPKLLRNIQKVDCRLTIYSTGGKSLTDLVGDFPGFGEVWLYPLGIANILSLSLVKKEISYHL